MSTRTERLKDLRLRAIDAARLHEHAQRKYSRDQTATGIVRVTKEEMGYLVEPFIHEDKQQRADTFEAAHGWRALPMLKEIHACYAEDHDTDVSMPGRFVLDLIDFDFWKKPEPEPCLDEPRKLPERKPVAPRHAEELIEIEVRFGDAVLPVFNFLITHGSRREGTLTITLDLIYSEAQLAALRNMMPTSDDSGIRPLVIRKPDTDEKKLVGSLFISHIDPDEEKRMIRVQFLPVKDLWMPTRSNPNPPDELLCTVDSKRIDK